jgi:nucleoside-diphosphate-sugar epimerase
VTKKILVTGAAGFVGQALCRHLAASGYRVTGQFRTAPLRTAWMETRTTGDLTNIADFGPLVDGADAVIHLAARVHMMRDTAADPEAAFLQANADVARKLAQAAAENGVRRFVFLSSVKVNGEATTTASYKETDPPAPEDAYGRSKLAAETALAEISATTQLPVTTLRIPLVYGPGVRANFASLMGLCDTVLPLPLTGITKNRRSLLFLGNLTHAIERVVAAGGQSSGTFLLSDGEDLSTADLVRRLRRCLNRPVCGIPVPGQIIAAIAALAGKRAAADRLCGSLQVAPSLFGETFDWTPPFSVDQGLAATVARRRATA